MGKSLRKKPAFQLLDIPNKLKRQAKDAGETWMREGAFCSGCKERGTPAIVSVRKDPKDNANYFFMLCRTCVDAADKKAEEAAAAEQTAVLTSMMRRGKSELAEIVEMARENIQAGKDELDAQKSEEE